MEACAHRGAETLSLLAEPGPGLHDPFLLEQGAAGTLDGGRCLLDIPTSGHHWLVPLASYELQGCRLPAGLRSAGNLIAHSTGYEYTAEGAFRRSDACHLGRGSLAFQKRLKTTNWHSSVRTRLLRPLTRRGLPK